MHNPTHDSGAALNKDFQSLTSLAKLKQPDLGNIIQDSKTKLGQELGINPDASNRSQAADADKKANLINKMK